MTSDAEKAKEVQGVIPDAIRDGLQELHDTNPHRENFSAEEVILTAWSHHDHPWRRRVLAGTNLVRGLFGREPKEETRPSGPFKMPGVPRALGKLAEHGEVVCEYVVDDKVVERKAYLDPEQNGGVRNSLSASQHARYRLVAQVHEEPQLSTASQNGNGHMPGARIMQPETPPASSL